MGIGTKYLAAGDRDSAERIWGQLEELAARIRDPSVIVRPLQVEAALASWDGRLEAALDAGQRLVRRANELGGQGLNLARNVLQRPLLRLGRAQDVLELNEQLAAATGSRYGGRASQSLCLAHLGRITEAQEAAREAPELSYPWRLEIALLAHDGPAAVELAEILNPLAGAAAVHEDPVCVARLLGEAAALNGDAETAFAFYQQSLRVAAQVRNRPEIAETRLRLAELLLQQAQPETAQAEHLDFAIAEFRDMKMQPSLERALKHKGLLGA